MPHPKVPQEISNPINDNIKKLASLFPSAVKDGELDLEALKQELGQFTEVGTEKYELTWAGKQQAKQTAFTPILGRTLKYIPEESKNPDTTQNLYIEGDNLEVLKLLRQNYYGAVKMIYIDPPYNTGNDFIYNDNFRMTKEESGIAEGDVSDLGERYTVNRKDHNRYHTNWLNMMYPRLRVAKDLLRDDGVIFISIDDDEQCNLRNLCDEVFGEENFIDQIAIEITKTQGMKVKAAKEGSIVKNHEYVIIYSKTTKQNKRIVKNILYDKGEIFDNHYSYVLISHDEYYVIEKLVEYLPNIMDAKIIIEKFLNEKLKLNDIKKLIDLSPEFKKIIYIDLAKLIHQETACDIAIPENIKNKIREDIVIEWNGYLLKKTSTGNIRQFISLENSLAYNHEYNSEYGRVTIRGDLWKNFYSDMMNVAKEGNVDLKNGKKPIRLIKQLLFWISNEKNEIILDFFSGSSTTAHAVMQLNAEDNGSRKYIMVQLPETCDETSEAFKAGYKNICEIGKERIRRAGEKILEENKEKEGIENLDVGFKVFRVGDTNINWLHQDLKGADIFDHYQKNASDKDKLDFTPQFTDLDVVYEIMLRQADIPLSCNVEKLSAIGGRTYLFADSFVVCLEQEITKELVDKLAAIEPLPIKFIFRDSAFDDDISLKDWTFRMLSALIDRNSGGEKQTYTVEFI